MDFFTTNDFDTSMEHYKYCEKFYTTLYNYFSTNILEVKKKRKILMDNTREIIKNKFEEHSLKIISHKIWINDSFEVPDDKLNIYIKNLQYNNINYFWCIDKNILQKTIGILKNYNVKICLIDEIIDKIYGKNIFLNLLENKYYTAATDILRFNLLYLYGGIYSDLGVVYNTDINKYIVNFDIVFGQEGFNASPGFIYAPKNSNIISNLLRFLEQLNRIPNSIRNCGDDIRTPAWFSICLFTLMIDLYTTEIDKILPCKYSIESIVNVYSMGSWLKDTYGQKSLILNPIPHSIIFGTDLNHKSSYKLNSENDCYTKNYFIPLIKELYNIDEDYINNLRNNYYNNFIKTYYSFKKNTDKIIIPQISHRCWLTDNDNPHEVDENILKYYENSLKTLSIDKNWEHYFWCINKDKIPLTIKYLKKIRTKLKINLKILEIKNILHDMKGKIIFEEFYKDKRYCNANDILRLNILNIYGGVYSDIGFEIKKDLTTLLYDYNRIFFLRDFGNIDHCFCGLQKNDIIINKYLYMLDHLYILSENIKKICYNPDSQLMFTGCHYLMLMLDLYSEKTDNIMFISNGEYIQINNLSSWGSNPKFGNKSIFESNINIFNLNKKEKNVFSNSFNKNFINYFENENGNSINIGEYIFYEGAMKIFTENGYNIVRNIEKLNCEGDIYAIVASNVINSYDSSWALWMHSDIDKLKDNVKIVVICSGLQNLDDNVNPIIISLFKRIQDRNKNSIYVRGEYSKNLLEKYGIISESIGCPSVLLIDMPVIQNNIINKDSSKIKLVYSTTSNFQEESNYKLHIYGNKYKGTFICQTEYIIYEWSKYSNTLDIFCNNLIKEKYEDNNFLETKNYLQNNVENSMEIINNLKNCVFPFNLDNWFEILDKHNFYIGSRIHGTIMALLNGCRAICIVHDIRTKELCEILYIPYIDKLDIDKDILYYYNLGFSQKFYDNIENIQKKYYSIINK